MQSFWIQTFALVFLRAADMGITFAASPDLGWEMNPLVSLAGLGWGALILSNVLGVALIVFFYRHAYSFTHSGFPQSSGYSFKQFISYYLFHDAESFHKIYYVVPYNKRALIEYCGYVAIRVVSAWSFLVVAHNLLVWQLPAYRSVMASGKLWLSLYGLLVFLVLAYSFLFFVNLYRRYRGNDLAANVEEGEL